MARTSTTKPMPIVSDDASLDAVAQTADDGVDGYVPPKRFVVDVATALRIEERERNPRPPNAAILALFKK